MKKSNSTNIRHNKTLTLAVGFGVTISGVGAEDSVGCGVSGTTTGFFVGRGVKVGFCVGTGTGLSV